MSGDQEYSDNPAFLLLKALIAKQKTFYATGNGNVGGTTIVCSEMTGLPDFDGSQIHIVDPDSNACDQTRDIEGATTAGTITVKNAFACQITQDTAFIISGIRSTPVEVANLETWIKTAIGDSSAHTLTSLVTKWGDIARSLDLILGARWDSSSDLGTDIATIITAISAIQNNTRFTAAVPTWMCKPDAGNEAFRVSSNLYDTEGNMEDPVNNEILVRIIKDDGTYITATLYKDNAFVALLDNPTDDTTFPALSGWRAMEREAAGKFFFFNKVAHDATEESLTVEFGWTEGIKTNYQSRSTEIADVHGDLGAILADTHELQTDWANGGRLDLLLDACSTHSPADVRQSVCVTGDPANSIGKALYEIYVNRLTSTRAGYLDELAATNIPADIDKINEVLAQTGIFYFVGKGGNDANDGKSWTKRRLTVASGYGLCSAGDTLIIGAGIFTEDINFNTDGVWSIGRGQGDDGTEIYGTSTMTCRSNRFENIFFFDNTGTVVKVGNDASANYNEFPNCRIGGAGSAIPLHIDAGVAGGGSFNIFDTCNIYEGSQAAILIDGGAAIGNIFRTCRVRPQTGVASHGIHINHASALRNTFIDCDVVGGGSTGTGIYFQAGTHNIAFKCHVDDITTPYNIAANNYIVGCHEGSLIATNNTIQDDFKVIYDDVVTVDGIVDNILLDTQLKFAVSGSKTIATGVEKYLDIDSGTDGAEIISITLKGVVSADWTVELHIPTDDGVASPAAGDKRAEETYVNADTVGGQLKNIGAIRYNMFLDITNDSAGDDDIDEVIIAYRSRGTITATWET